MELLAAGYCDGISPRSLENWIGQVNGGKVSHRLHDDRGTTVLVNGNRA